MMKVCHICNMDSGKHLLGCWSVDHIKDVEQQLAAANARIAELHDDEAMEKMYQEGLHNGAIEANKRLTEARAALDTHGALAEHYKRRAEQADVENKRMRDALEEIRCCVTTCNTPIETVHAMDNIAAAALDPNKLTRKDV